MKYNNRIFLLSLCAMVFISFSACRSDNGQQVKAADHVAETDEVQGHHDHDGHDHSTHDHDHETVSTPSENTAGSVQSPETEMRKAGKEGNTIGLVDPNAPENQTRSAPEIIKRDANNNPIPPNACALVTPEFLGKVLGVNAGTISVKDGSSATSPHARSCFFRWEHEGAPNSGVLVQVQVNPVPHEFPDWAIAFVDAKKTAGEQSIDGSAGYRYKDFSGMGDDGAYNFELSRYIWRISNEYVFLIAFNLPSTEGQEVKWAQSIGKEVMKNFNS